MKVEDAAYIAGIIDGDGYIGFQCQTRTEGKNRYHCWNYCVGITMIHYDLLNTINKMVNCGKGKVLIHTYQPRGRAHRAYRILWSGSRCIDLLNEIRPYLRLKVAQADIILQFAQKQEEAQSQRSGQGHRYPDWLHVLAENINKQICILNRRGIDRQSELLVKV